MEGYINSSLSVFNTDDFSNFSMPIGKVPNMTTCRYVCVLHIVVSANVVGQLKEVGTFLGLIVVMKIFPGCLYFTL